MICSSGGGGGGGGGGSSSNSIITVHTGLRPRDELRRALVGPAELALPSQLLLLRPPALRGGDPPLLQGRSASRTVPC